MSAMCISTNASTERYSLRQALTMGLAPDGGLLMPESLPRMPQAFLDSLPGMSFQEIAYALGRALLGDLLDDGALRRLITEAFSFPLPLRRLSDKLSVLELFHGPSLAFKDVGARFMAALLQELRALAAPETTILVATSGDTGAAVAHAFYKRPGFRVVVLYPSKRISTLQEQQIATLGGNVTAVEVIGTFDDCQRLVKQALLDREINEQMDLSSANSINLARLLPQIFYYFYALSQLPKDSLPVVFAVPSGNLGNLCAGLFAARMGLPHHKFVAALNANTALKDFFSSGVLTPRPAQATISNAMDVGNPSNMARIVHLYGADLNLLRSDIAVSSHSDTQTRAALAELQQRYGYIADPHTAVGYLGAKEYAADFSSAWHTVVLATAHPAKFAEALAGVVTLPTELPAALQAARQGKKYSILAPPDFAAIKRILLAESSSG